MNKIFIKYVESLLNDINNPSFIHEWKLNIDDAAHEKKIYANVYKPSAKK